MQPQDAVRPAEPAGTSRLGVVGAVATAYLVLFGATLWWALGAASADAIVCFAPAAIAAVLGATSQADRRQYVARLLAAVLFLTIGLVMWAASHDAAGWWLAAFVLFALAAFLALVFWLGSFATRIQPAAGTVPVRADVLVRRLQSLALPGSLIAVSTAHAGTAASLVLQVPVGDERWHRVTLDIDERARAVGVREFVGASGAAPRDASERSMRSPGDRYFDPTRPHAQAVWTRTWQATMIEPEKLRATSVRLNRDRVELELDALAHDPDALITLLAAVVTCSGYAWRPSLLLPGRRARKVAMR